MHVQFILVTDYAESLKLITFFGISVSGNWKLQVSTVWENEQCPCGPPCMSPWDGGSGWLHQGRYCSFSQTVLTCSFQLPETEIPQKLLTPNFLHNRSKRWTARACNESCVTHLLPLATTSSIPSHIWSWYADTSQSKKIQGSASQWQ